MKTAKHPINQATEVAVAPTSASEISEQINHSSTVEISQPSIAAIDGETDAAMSAESNSMQTGDLGQSQSTESSERTNDAEICNPAAEAAEEVNEPDLASDPRVVALVNEAEQRGYLRGRNEKIEELMAKPGLFQPLTPVSSVSSTAGQSEVLILNNMRPSIWDL